MNFSKYIVSFTIALVGFSIVSSCNKKKDTIAKIYVYDQNKNPMLGVRVIVKAEPSESSIGKTLILADTATTNISGEAIFNFNYLYQKGQAGVAVLNIYASNDTLQGTGIIQVKEEVTTEATVYLN